MITQKNLSRLRGIVINYLARLDCDCVMENSLLPTSETVCPLTKNFHSLSYNI